jgi:hypothetical protein
LSNELATYIVQNDKPLIELVNWVSQTGSFSSIKL